MLSAPDAGLVRRDPALAGLGRLLDPEAFVSTLAEAAPGARLGAAQITYIRYKPGTSCLIAYRVEIDGASVEMYAKTRRAGDLAPIHKAAHRAAFEGPGGLRRVVLERLTATVTVFPNDDRLKGLPLLHDADGRSKLTRRAGLPRGDLRHAAVHTLAYKPERRYVGELRGAEARAVLKCYDRREYGEAAAANRALDSGRALRLAPLLGCSDRHCMLAFGWVEGQLLSELLADPLADLSPAGIVGAALAEVHAQRTDRLPCLGRRAEAGALFAAAGAIGTTCPHLTWRAGRLASSLADRLRARPAVNRPIHGDFYARQVLLAGESAAVLDLDRAALGDPAFDLGTFGGHLEREVLYQRLAPERAALAWETVLAGYRSCAPLPDRTDLELQTAAALLRLGPEPFRRHEPDWPRWTEAIVRRAEALVERGHNGRAMPSPVLDRPGVAGDPAMPFLPHALDPKGIRRHILGSLAASLGAAHAHLCAVRMVRYKPGRRCLIEYEVLVETPAGSTDLVTVLGKARARGADRTSYALHHALRAAGLDAGSADGTSVPEPVALIPELHMWLQRKVPGVPATELVGEAGAAQLGRRIAEAAHRLHQAGIESDRRHTMADELAILRDRLSRLARMRPEWERRIERLFRGCERLAGGIAEPAARGIHRDLYPDQVLVDGGRLYLVDLDLYCAGDPALDIGNFSGHLTEQSLRRFGRPDALEACDLALRERFAELRGGNAGEAVAIYATLTLARHLYLSTQFEDRRGSTGALLDFCEERLAVGEAVRT